MARQKKDTTSRLRSTAKPVCRWGLLKLVASVIKMEDHEYVCVDPVELAVVLRDRKIVP